MRLVLLVSVTALLSFGCSGDEAPIGDDAVSVDDDGESPAADGDNERTDDGDDSADDGNEPATATDDDGDEPMPPIVMPPPTSPGAEPPVITVGEPGEDPPPPTPTGPSNVGRGCAEDADCMDGLTCLLDTGNGRIPQGLCSRTCTERPDVNECADLGGDTTCFQGLCSKLCINGSNDGNCFNRSSQFCANVGEAPNPNPNPAPNEPETIRFGFCQPLCLNDDACGAGSFCDKGTGLCVDTAPTGAPLGASCTVPEDCAGGLCIQIQGEASGYCSNACSIGPVGGCNELPNVPPDFACLINPNDAAQGIVPGLLDLGICSPFCDVDADCPAPGLGCGILEGFVDVSGRAGICVPADTLGEPGAMMETLSGMLPTSELFKTTEPQMTPEVVTEAIRSLTPAVTEAIRSEQRWNAVRTPTQ